MSLATGGEFAVKSCETSAEAIVPDELTGTKVCPDLVGVTV